MGGDWGVILKPLLADLHVLCTDGLHIVDDQQTVTVYGKLSVICGDNLAVHSLAGFVQNFSSKSPCRFCLGSPSSWQDKFWEKDFVLRDRKTYDEQLKLAKKDEFGTKALQCGIRGYASLTNCQVSMSQNGFLRTSLMMFSRVWYLTRWA